MLKKIISKWLTGAAALGFAAGTMAAPYSVTYTDTASNSAVGVIAGQPATIKIVLDNGNASTATQTWTSANLQCIIFTFNGGNLSLAINYSGAGITFATGSFTTNAGGALATVPDDWEDTSDPILRPIVTNIVGINPMQDWFVDGLNEVLRGNGTDISFTNVAHNRVAADWTNPVPASGVCAGAPPPQTQQPIPTLNQWGVLALSSLLAFGAVLSLRRRRQ